MTYLFMSLPFIGVAFLVSVLGAVHAHRRRAFATYLSAWVVATASLIVLTVIFDNVMMAAGFFDYGVEHISGVRLGLIPIEDLLYPFAGTLLLGGAWQILGDARESGAYPRQESRDA